MASREAEGQAAVESAGAANYPFKATTAFLNERLGLYLSAEQQRGFATGLLIGTAVGAGLLAWNLLAAIRRNS